MKADEMVSGPAGNVLLALNFSAQREKKLEPTMQYDETERCPVRSTDDFQVV